jgi:hypothetical protein
LFKANLPTQISRRVEGERNSKIILDEENGEKILDRDDLVWKYGGGMIRLEVHFWPGGVRETVAAGVLSDLSSGTRRQSTTVTRVALNYL